MTSNGNADSMRFLMNQHVVATSTVILQKLSENGYRSNDDETEQIQAIFATVEGSEEDKWRGGCSVDLYSMVTAIQKSGSVLEMTGTKTSFLA